MSQVKFSETIFAAQGKEGNLPGPDANGYYTLVIGGLNCYNSAGEYYVATGVVDMFQESSHFMRRIKNGALFAEVGHPRKAPGMSHMDFYRRIIDIDEKNVCAHIGEVTLDFTYGKNNAWLNNPDFVAIIGKIKPAGPHAQALERSLQNPKQNTAFSVRGLTDNAEVRGRVERKLTQIVTFDHVNEPGIAAACKAHTPGLESLSVVSQNDVSVQPELLRRVLSELSNDPRLATEHHTAMRQEILARLPQLKEASFKDW